MKTISIHAPIICFVCLCVHAQEGDQAYHHQLNRFSGNKLILLGDWSAEDRAKWNEMLASLNLSEYDFNLLGRANQQWTAFFSNDGINGLEAWIRQQSGSPSSRWVVFDESNSVIASGISIPDTDALSAAMERFGIKSNLKQLRNFLKTHPDHVDARAYLLKEVRRRALLATPGVLDADLDKMDDLRIWGVLAREFDLAMNLDWIGFNLEFFRPDETQPELFSPLMKAVFRKHIGRVEDAIRELPTNKNLWDLWAWMARTLNDRPALQFIQSLEPFELSAGPKRPSAKVATWLINAAKSKEDWETVIQLAKIGRGFNSYMIESRKWWSPGRFTRQTVSMPIAGYPEQSSYYPLLEALLKLGRIDEANDVFDELIRNAGDWSAQGAASIARANGLEELAEIWSKGVIIKSVPYTRPPPMEICLIVLTDQGSNDWRRSLQLAGNLTFRLSVYNNNTWPGVLETLSWSGNDFRWALIGEDGFVIEQGTRLPTPEELQKIIDDNKIKSPKELAEEFLRKNPNNIEAIITFGVESLIEGVRAMERRQDNEIELDSNQDEAIWGKAASSWAKIFNNDRVIYAIPNFYTKKVKLNSPAMKSISRRYIPKIEAAIRLSPGSEALWTLWLFWRNAGDNERNFEALLDSIEPSPAELKGACPPPIVFEAYYSECKENNQWRQIIKLLKEPWDRGISEQIIENNAKEKADKKPFLVYPELGDSVGYPLIEALLQSGKRQEADDVFKAWINCGGRFSNFADLIELASKFGGERFAGGWQAGQ